MGSPQTTILGYGQPGAIQGLATKIIDSESAINEEASSNIGFGLGVKPGTKTKGVLLPTASSSIFNGVTIQNFMFSPGTFGDIDQSGTPPGIKPNCPIEVITEGRAWVRVDVDCTVTPNVTRAYWRFETDGASNTLVGTFRHSDDGHVVDVRNDVLFVGPVIDAADILTGATVKICEVVISRSNKQ